MRVGVIGSGVAGLVAGKAFRYQELVIFEQNGYLGGTWAYRSSPEATSAVYASLRTNLPKQIMNIPQFPFKDELSSFPGHEHVLEYLEDFAAVNDLMPCIRFDTKVINVSPIDSDQENTTWKVSSMAKDGKYMEDIFDKIIVANGHFTKPYIPTIEGIQHFTGQVLHSKCYRIPHGYKDLNVLVVGKGSSGQDISLELVGVAKKVYVSYRGTQQESQDERTHVPPIRKIHPNQQIEFEDGTIVQADAILFCTGYLYDFPFFNASVLEPNDGFYIPELYEHLFHVKYAKSLAFLAIPFSNIPFLLSTLQVRWVHQVFNSSTDILPTYQQRQDAISAAIAQLHAELLPLKQYHKLGEKQFQHYANLASKTSLHLPQYLAPIYFDTAKIRSEFPKNYRNLNYEIIENQQWQRN